MGQTSIALTISSNIGGDSLNFTTTFSAVDSTLIGLPNSSGLATKVIGTSNVLLIDLSDTPIDIEGKKAHLFIKNKAVPKTTTLNVIFGDTSGTYITALTLAGGEFALLPLSALADSDGAGTPADINVVSNVAGTTIEYLLIYN
jgi:hypothetical protein